MLYEAGITPSTFYYQKNPLFLYFIKKRRHLWNMGDEQSRASASEIENLERLP